MFWVMFDEQVVAGRPTLDGARQCALECAMHEPMLTAVWVADAELNEVADLGLWEGGEPYSYHTAHPGGPTEWATKR